jgi:hypothetical protein
VEYLESHIWEGVHQKEQEALVVELMPAHALDELEEKDAMLTVQAAAAVAVAELERSRGSMVW